ncbi:hypothetical protein ZHAS_00010947 [Anopheles sinensis]|uniref:Uncharacterized protein n=1 Tax=Anopheles sinensis TaxID=74873 RepID=A0A084VYX9_ANOSI|nr:hypothetical protein ZHAS_00010947 [Anopheles sinensis]
MKISSRSGSGTRCGHCQSPADESDVPEEQTERTAHLSDRMLYDMPSFDPLYDYPTMDLNGRCFHTAVGIKWWDLWL